MNPGLLIIDFLLLILSFAALHFVSERYFIESLDHLSKKLRLSSDMAGSTLMAAGSSAPELAVALFAVLMKGNHEQIGIGTIVGSALFNILVITGAVMYLRTRAKLIWQPIFRDVLFYIIAIVLLAFIFIAGEVNMFSAALLMGSYLVYIFVVYYWKRIFPYEDAEDEPDKRQLRHRVLRSSLDRISRPLDIVLGRNQFFVFVISIGLISLLSWLLVSSAVGISEALGVPELLIGITIVAIGTSVPDLISSVIVARQGRPGMAVNNAIGSNIFDILVGLGLPFLLYSLFTGDGINLVARDLALSISILLGSSIVLLLFFLLRGWRTSRTVGVVLIILYLAYLVQVIFTFIC
jgi:K+-dependent Na+/Ca+ exchanger-like protein